MDETYGWKDFIWNYLNGTSISSLKCTRFCMEWSTLTPNINHDLGDPQEQFMEAANWTADGMDDRFMKLPLNDMITIYQHI